MNARGPKWYKENWTLDIKGQSWVEDTEKQVDFLIETMELTGHERILDLACGFGRHALAFSERGFEVLGVDITKAFIDDATATATARSLSAQFLCADIRSLCFCCEFDVVVNLADGAIGYLEDDEQNEMIFDVAARALKPGGFHFIDICDADHAEAHFPKRHWEVGQHALALAEFEWNPSTRRMLYGGTDIPFGEIAQPPKAFTGDPIRLYSRAELEQIYAARGMGIVSTFGDWAGAAKTIHHLQLLLLAQKAHPAAEMRISSKIVGNRRNAVDGEISQ